MHIILSPQKPLTTLPICTQLMGDNNKNPAPIHLVINEASTVTTNTQQNQHQQLKPLLPSILTRLHAGYFKISFSFCSQALLWKILSHESTDDEPLWHLFRMLPSTAFVSLWCLAFFTLILLSLLYILRCMLRFQMVKAEFLHHVGANYLFVPWISWLLLLQSAPLIVPKSVPYLVLWWVFVVPVFVLDVKIYGQWFTTEKRFLSMVANPMSQLSVIGNLVGAQAAAEMGWKESAVCLFSLGMAHYLVLFVTLYQSSSGDNRLPAMLRPVFFSFIAAPSMASLAWKSISGTFDTPSKMLFFLSLFFFTSLACRPLLFKKSVRQFNIACWAYSFPLTFLALASVEYAKEVKGHTASLLMLLLSALSILVFVGLILVTGLNIDKLLLEKDPLLNSANDVKNKGTMTATGH